MSLYKIIIKVLDEKVKHIHYVPPVPEPYYVPTGKEVQPKPVGEELGIVIYQYFPISAVNYVIHLDNNKIVILILHFSLVVLASMEVGIFFQHALRQKKTLLYSNPDLKAEI